MSKANFTTTTLCFLTKPGQILLAQKKRGFGKDWWNGYGGKVKEEETITESLIREVAEEAAVTVSEPDLQKVAIIDFYFKDKIEWNQQCHVFLANAWQGEPQESEEMRPQWFAQDQIPFSAMWPTDYLWLPRILAGETLQGEVYFQDGSGIAEKSNFQIAPNI